jgi:acetyl-CoA acetyltransferase
MPPTRPARAAKDNRAERGRALVGGGMMANGGVAIVGIGSTKFTRDPEQARGVGELAVEACRRAIDDAGLAVSDIDGLLSYSMGDSIPTRDAAGAIGLSTVSWFSDIASGGTFTAGIVEHAALAIRAGLAKRVLIYRAMNGYSGKRIGGTGDASADSGRQFTIPFGMAAAAEIFGMPARRHMHRYGTTKEHFGAVAITMRAHAVNNERAIRRDPITMDDYLSSRMIADPYRLLDCCQETDGACAIVVCGADEAATLRRKPVHLLGAVLGGGPNPRLPFDRWADMDESHFGVLAKQLYAKTGLSARDVSVGLIYDAFTWEVIKQLEDFGFCPAGEGGPFVASGAISMTGSIPVNPHGGLHSEAYVHGFNHVVEAVRQLRGDAGIRQVPAATVALVTGFAFTAGSAMLLGSEPLGA